MFPGGTVDDDTLQFYRRNAEAYAKREITSRQTRLNRFLALLPPGAAILELGCGAGGDSAEMLARGFDVSPTDGSPEMAEVASRRLGRAVATLLFHDLDELEAYDGVWADFSPCYHPVPPSSNSDAAPAAIPKRCSRKDSTLRRRMAHQKWQRSPRCASAVP